MGVRVLRRAMCATKVDTLRVVRASAQCVERGGATTIAIRPHCVWSVRSVGSQLLGRLRVRYVRLVGLTWIVSHLRSVLAAMRDTTLRLARLTALCAMRESMTTTGTRARNVWAALWALTRRRHPWYAARVRVASMTTTRMLRRLATVQLPSVLRGNTQTRRRTTATIVLPALRTWMAALPRCV